MPLNLDQNLSMHSHLHLPLQVGLGIHQVEEQELATAVETALAAGYRCQSFNNRVPILGTGVVHFFLLPFNIFPMLFR